MVKQLTKNNNSPRNDSDLQKSNTINLASRLNGVTRVTLIVCKLDAAMTWNAVLGTKRSVRESEKKSVENHRKTVVYIIEYTCGFLGVVLSFFRFVTCPLQGVAFVKMT